MGNGCAKQSYVKHREEGTDEGRIVVAGDGSPDGTAGKPSAGKPSAAAGKAHGLAAKGIALLGKAAAGLPFPGAGVVGRLLAECAAVYKACIGRAELLDGFMRTLQCLEQDVTRAAQRFKESTDSQQKVVQQLTAARDFLRKLATRGATWAELDFVLAAEDAQSIAVHQSALEHALQQCEVPMLIELKGAVDGLHGKADMAQAKVDAVHDDVKKILHRVDADAAAAAAKAGRHLTNLSSLLQPHYEREEFTEIEARWKAMGAQSDAHRLLAITGSSGSGRGELAKSIALKQIDEWKRAGRAHTLAWRMDARIDGLAAAYSELLKQFGLAVKQEPCESIAQAHERGHQSLLSALRMQQYAVLLWFDNVSTFRSIAPYLPFGANLGATVLLTSTHQHAIARVHIAANHLTLPLYQGMTPQGSLRLLELTSRVPLNETTRPGALQLALVLDHQPLALVHAGRYVRNVYPQEARPFELVFNDIATHQDGTAVLDSSDEEDDEDEDAEGPLSPASNEGGAGSSMRSDGSPDGCGGGGRSKTPLLLALRGVELPYRRLLEYAALLLTSRLICSCLRARW
jgi:hypothetical protein